MKLSSFLNHRLIKVNHAVENNEGVIKGLLETICREYNWNDEIRESVYQKVMEREELGATLLETGVAIPHARLENFQDLIIALSIPSHPIIVEEKEIRLFFLILTSKVSSKLYLNILAAVAKLSKNQEIMQEILKAGRPEEVIRAVEKSGLKVKKDLVTADLMDKEFFTVSPLSTLKEVIDLFFKFRKEYAPVVDEEGNLVGEVDAFDIIKVGIPDYVTSMASLDFLRSFEPLEELLRSEEEIRVEKVMRKPQITLSPDSSLIEAAFQLYRHRRRYLPVVEGDKIVGVFTLSDLIIKILRG